MSENGLSNPFRYLQTSEVGCAGMPELVEAEALELRVFLA